MCEQEFKAIRSKRCEREKKQRFDLERNKKNKCGNKMRLEIKYPWGHYKPKKHKTDKREHDWKSVNETGLAICIQDDEDQIPGIFPQRGLLRSDRANESISNVRSKLIYFT